MNKKVVIFISILFCVWLLFESSLSSAKASCAGVGEEGDVYGKQCCSGLISVAPNIKELDYQAGKYCNEIYPSVGTQFICINCGDGVCGAGENRCNCSKDCGSLPPYQGVPNLSCQSIGLRKSGQYCSGDKIWTIQKDANKPCDNSFECKSNVCVSDKCVNASLMQKIIEWFRNLFRF